MAFFFWSHVAITVYKQVLKVLIMAYSLCCMTPIAVVSMRWSMHHLALTNVRNHYIFHLAPIFLV